MPGLVPGIHVAPSMPYDVDGRDKPGHDGVETGERKTAIVERESSAPQAGGGNPGASTSSTAKPEAIQTHSKISMAHLISYAISE